MHRPDPEKIVHIPPLFQLHLLLMKRQKKLKRLEFFSKPFLRIRLEPIIIPDTCSIHIHYMHYSHSHFTRDLVALISRKEGGGLSL